MGFMESVLRRRLVRFKNRISEYISFHMHSVHTAIAHSPVACMFSVLRVHVCHLLRAAHWRNLDVRLRTLGQFTNAHQHRTVCI